MTNLLSSKFSIFQSTSVDTLFLASSLAILMYITAIIDN